MLLKPFENYIPKFFNRDEKLIAFSDKMDEIINSSFSEIIGLSSFVDPVKMPSLILNDIGSYLNAGILSTDSDRTKRQKIYNAISSHKKRGTWLFDVKPTIDSVVGFDSQLFGSSGDSSDFIVLGQESSDPDFYWGTIGIDGIDDELGIDIVGDGNEAVLAGVFLIDVGTGIDLPIQDVENIKNSLVDKIPDYFRVFLGYQSGGVFIAFSNGQIN